jgi:anti-sigma factor RsiW
MTPASNTAADNGAADREPTELEALLPFHAAGTLGLRDARRVEEALAADPDLARQYAVIQDEFAETILLNESLGAPSARAMQKLFAAIDAEPSPKASFNPLMRIAGFFSSLSPRTLAYAGIAAACVVLVQTGVIGTVLVKDRAGGTFETAAFPAQPAAGTFALLRFAPDASVADITQLLDAYQASIVSGPKAGMFRVKFGDKALSKQETEQLLTRIQSEKIVSLVAATD